MSAGGRGIVGGRNRDNSIASPHYANSSGNRIAPPFDDMGRLIRPSRPATNRGYTADGPDFVYNGGTGYERITRTRAFG